MEMIPYTWSFLATMAGAAAGTLMIVQYLKDALDKLVVIPTRIFALVVAFLILLGAQAFTAGLSWPDVPLIAMNAVMVALSAIGAYDSAFAPKYATDYDEQEPPASPGNPA